MGKRVSTNDGRKGTISRVDTAWSYCYVKFDGDGKEIGFLYSLLNSEAGSNSLSLATGFYECVTGENHTTLEMRVTGADSYSAEGRTGKFHIESNGRIVFESGPLKEFFSRLLSGGRIGLNQDGGNFFPTACELNRNRR